MSKYTRYRLYQKYEKRGDQEAIPVYPNTYSINGGGTMPLVIVKDNDPTCGYNPQEPIYRWYQMPIESYYICDECESPTPPTPPAPSYSGQYLTFTATESGTFKFTGNSLSYSLDSGTTWTTLASNTNSPTVAAGNKIMWKATITPTSGVKIGRFYSSGAFTAEGNIMSLLYGDNFQNQTTLSSEYVFGGLFGTGATLTNAENLILPATTLSTRCYAAMFKNCNSLVKAPALPATTLAELCYSNMFWGCTSLTTAPDLPATTLATQCYYYMFEGCSSLNYIKCLATDISAGGCTDSWVHGVAANGTFVKNSSMSSWTRGVDGIPNNWSIQNA